MKRAICISFCLLVGAQGLLAGAFVQKGFSARSSSLGNSYTALSNDVAGIFFNPAGLAEMTGIQVQSSFARLFPDVEDDNLNLLSGGAVIGTQGMGSFGIGASFFNSENWKESEFAGAYAMSMWSGASSRFSVGGTFRMLHWSAVAAPGEGALSYTGFTLNAGVLYSIKNFLAEDKDDFTNSLRIGAHVENLTRPSVAVNGSTDAKLPMNIEGGIAYVSGAYDYVISTTFAYSESRTRMKAGAEFVVAKGEVIGSPARVVVRIGGDRDAHENSQGEYSGGFGLVWNSIVIDYVYLYPVELLAVGGTQRISLQYNF